MLAGIEECVFAAGGEVLAKGDGAVTQPADRFDVRAEGVGELPCDCLGLRLTTRNAAADETPAPPLVRGIAPDETDFGFAVWVFSHRQNVDAGNRHRALD